MHSNRGVSLVEAMIGITILAVGSLILSQLFIFQSQRQKAVEVRANYNSIRMQGMGAAADPAALLHSALKNVTVSAAQTPSGSNVSPAQ